MAQLNYAKSMTGGHSSFNLGSSRVFGGTPGGTQMTSIPSPPHSLMSFVTPQATNTQVYHVDKSGDGTITMTPKLSVERNGDTPEKAKSD